MSEVNAYLIPGMGADHRLYQRFDLGNWKVHHLDWVDHEDSKTLADYARVMARRITTENNVIIGSSMGGMMAVELSHIIKPLLTVLVSAPTGRQEFPPILNAVRAIRLQKLFGPRTTYRLSLIHI
jgi:pimeloyl-ACP methyl ester carboxylesterase